MVRGLKAAIGGGVAALALAVVPSTAGAADAVSVYSPDAEARSFTTTAGGFTGASESSGLCLLPPVLCPSIDNTHEPSGGTGGASDGFLSTSVRDLADVAGESRATWTGAPFTYAGAGGQPPTDVALTVTRKSNLGALLSVVGNEAEYSVELIDETAGGTAITLIDGASLAPTQGWAKSGLVAVNPAELTIGHTYRFRIVSRFVYGAEVLKGGSAGYDDLMLVATRVEGDDGGPGGPGGPGGDGGGGNGNDGGRGGNNPGNNALFDGRNLFIKLKCFGEQKNGKCLSRATALKSKKGKRFTFPVQRVVNAKKGKVIRARVRFQFRAELERQRSIVLRSVLRTSRDDKSKTVKYKKLKLTKRGN
jgi:hypothetical protein